MAHMKRGRPTKLDPGTADYLITLRRIDIPLEGAARMAGVHPATVRSWLRRAWSQRPEDQRAVAFTRRWLEAEALAEADEQRARGISMPRWRHPPAVQLPRAARSNRPPC